MAFSAELLPKRSATKKRLLLFGKTGHKKMNKKSAEYWYSVVFTDETRVKLTSDGIVRVFRKKTLVMPKKNCQKCDN